MGHKAAVLKSYPGKIKGCFRELTHTQTPLCNHGASSKQLESNIVS